MTFVLCMARCMKSAKRTRIAFNAFAASCTALATRFRHTPGQNLARFPRRGSCHLLDHDGDVFWVDSHLPPLLRLRPLLLPFGSRTLQQVEAWTVAHPRCREDASGSLLRPAHRRSRSVFQSSALSLDHQYRPSSLHGPCLSATPEVSLRSVPLSDPADE